MTIEPTIHIVDDDQPVRDSLQLLLESYQLASRAYRSCEDFVAGFVPGQPGCLLLDLHLPGMDGLDFLRTDRNAARNLPVIMMSGHWDDRTRALAMSAGVAGTIDKPIDDRLLIAIVRNLVGTANRRITATSATGT